MLTKEATQKLIEAKNSIDAAQEHIQAALDATEDEIERRMIGEMLHNFCVASGQFEVWQTEMTPYEL